MRYCLTIKGVRRHLSRDKQNADTVAVCFWKRAQILVAETWYEISGNYSDAIEISFRAAFHPDDNDPSAHPFFPNGVSDLTMFADYRVPQVLNRLGVIDYPASLKGKLQRKERLPYGCLEEVSIRSASILAVEEICKEIRTKPLGHQTATQQLAINSVLIDFWLWDMAKVIENESCGSTVTLGEDLPIHRTRSIWY